MNNPLIKKISLSKNSNTASLSSIALKEAFLILLVIISTLVTISAGYATSITTIVTGILGLLLVLFIAFYPQYSKLIAPLYAILEGMFLAGGSLMLETLYPGIVIQAILLTVCIALITAFIYASRIIRVNEQFKLMTTMSLGGLLGCYIVQFIATNLFNFSFTILNSGFLGIIIDIIIIGLAIACLLVDYEDINKLVKQGASKEQEWYYAISLLITLIWLYIRALELLKSTK